MSEGYRYAGSNSANAVAWYEVSEGARVTGRGFTPPDTGCFNAGFRFELMFILEEDFWFGFLKTMEAECASMKFQQHSGPDTLTIMRMEQAGWHANFPLPTWIRN